VLSGIRSWSGLPSAVPAAAARRSAVMMFS
jgi:hypothetical protein